MITRRFGPCSITITIRQCRRIFIIIPHFTRFHRCYYCQNPMLWSRSFHVISVTNLLIVGFTQYRFHLLGSRPNLFIKYSNQMTCCCFHLLRMLLFPIGRYVEGLNTQHPQN